MAENFVQKAKRLAREKGISYSAAAKQLAHDEPQLHAAFIDAAKRQRVRRGGQDE